MRSRYLVLGATFLLSGAWFPACAAAPVVPPLTLGQAIELALSSNPSLRAAGHSVAIADGVRLQAGLLPNPELSVLREGVQRGGRTQTVQISQPLELGGKRAARVRVAELDQTLATDTLRVTVAGLRADVTAAYFEVLTAQERATLAQGALELANKARSAASRRVAAGKISPVDASRSTVAVAGARLELATAQAELTGARRRLAALWGGSLPLEQPLILPEPTSLPPLATLRAGLESTPQLQRAASQVARETAQVRLEQAQRMPDVAVIVGSKKDTEPGRSQTVLGLSIPLPLFNRQQGNLLSALRRAEQAIAELAVTRLELEQALADAYQRAELAQLQLDTIRTGMLPAAQSALDATVTGFELGKFNFLDVLDAQRTLSQVRTQYLNAMSERYRALADVQRYAAPDQTESTK